MSRNILLVLLLLALPALADNPETLAERSQARARAVLDSAVVAIGGAENLQAIERVRLKLAGKTWPRLQMPTAQAPFEPGTFEETLLLDLANNRLKLEQRNSGAGFEGHNAVVLKAGEGTNYDLRARVATPIPTAQSNQQQFVQYYRRLPHLILRQALDRAPSLRHLGQDDFAGSPHEVITFVMPDAQQIALYVDAKTKLVSKYELVFTDPLVGEEASEILFGDYATVGAMKVPRTWANRQAGEVISEYALQVEFNPAVDESSFQVAAQGFAKAQPLPTTLEAAVDKLAEGVYVIRNVAGQNQNTLAVAFEDHVLAVEAPGSSAGADSVIKRIKETIPGKPIRYVAMTHHHGDHIGGLRSFIAEGATVITTRSNQSVVETMAKAPPVDRRASKPRPVELAFLENGKRVFTDGKRTVELIDIGPNPHAREMVIAWLPKEKIVFQGDLFGLPNNDAPIGPPQASTVAFARALKERKLDVEWIASVHGRTAKYADLERALQGAAGRGAD